MGTSTAGVAFRAKAPIKDLKAFLTGLFGEVAEPIPAPQYKYLDIRPHQNVVVMMYGNTYFVMNADLVEDVLRHPEKDVGVLAQKLGMPELFIAYCQFDSGNTCGYALVDHGRLTRSRVQTFDSVVETGRPKQFESDWLNAKHYIENDPGARPEERQKIYVRDGGRRTIAEHNLTSLLLQEALELHFGVCPWESTRQHEIHFFKLVEQKKAWWKRW